ncbi:MAG: glycoside hydrolase family 88 protein [Prevotellaceae bacterium]|nr:glycoside hydrolase family 88 protein [Prevotellaceae bacterium]
MKAYRTLALCSLLALTAVVRAQTEEVNDMNTPLHLLTPQYRIPYASADKDSIKASLDRVFQYIDAASPHSLRADGRLEQGAFRIGSYEWGITYQALLAASRITGDGRYAQYVSQRLEFVRDMYPLFQGKDTISDQQMEQICRPRALDDCGTMVTAMMKLQGKPGAEPGLDDVIENYYDFIDHRQYRMPEDGMLARHRPQYNTVWLDDIYMGLPAIAERGVYTGDTARFTEATRLYRMFVDRMWVPSKGLYRHGYVEGLRQQPTYHWARANGWALLTTVELLDILPQDHPDRPFLLAQLEKHVAGLAQYQSSEGFWHQLLDRPDSYLETSATAIYTYCIAHAINEGWLEGITYGPVAMLGWSAVESEITPEGKVEGTCVGTGMGFDPAFYYYRPVSSAAAHGYGPTIWAAAEMLRLLSLWHPRTNDSGLHFYQQPQTNPAPLFYLTEDGKGEAVNY